MLTPPGWWLEAWTTLLPRSRQSASPREPSEAVLGLISLGEQHDKGQAALLQKGAQEHLWGPAKRFRKLLPHRQGLPSSSLWSSLGGEAGGGFGVLRHFFLLISRQTRKALRGPQRACLEPCRAGKPKNWGFCLKGA